MLQFVYYVDSPNSQPPPTSSAIPISIPINQMTWEGTLNCDLNGQAPSQTYQISAYDCTLDDDKEPTNPSYGISCGTTGYFQYTFKGVQFLLYGNLSPNLGGFSVVVDDEFAGYVEELFKFDVVLDDEETWEVDSYEYTEIENTALLNFSRELKYGNHTVLVKGKGEPFEFYKHVFWLSLRARRVNVTQFRNTGTGTWVVESDNIGGIRSYTGPSNKGTKREMQIKCSKFWVYGSKANNNNKVYVGFGNVLELLDEYVPGPRIDYYLLYESPHIPYQDGELLFQVEEYSITLHCIYYMDEPPPPTPTPSPSHDFSYSVPISTSVKFT